MKIWSYILIRRRWRLCGAVERPEREFARTEGSSGVKTYCGIYPSPKFSTLYCLIIPMWPNAMHVSHWSWPTPTRCLPFTGHALHPCNACFRNCWLYLWPDVSINNIHWVHRSSRWYITLSSNLSLFGMGLEGGCLSVLLHLWVSDHISNGRTDNNKTLGLV